MEGFESCELNIQTGDSDHDVCKNKTKQKNFKTHQISVVKQVMLDI